MFSEEGSEIVRFYRSKIFETSFTLQIQADNPFEAIVKLQHICSSSKSFFGCFCWFNHFDLQRCIRFFSMRFKSEQTAEFCNKEKVETYCGAFLWWNLKTNSIDCNRCPAFHSDSLGSYWKFELSKILWVFCSFATIIYNYIHLLVDLLFLLHHNYGNFTLLMKEISLVPVNNVF